MNLDRIINMILNQIIRKLVNRGVDFGMDRVARRDERRDRRGEEAEGNLPRDASGKPVTGNRDLSKRARMAARTLRKLR